MYSMLISDYTYELPKEKIAIHPPEIRGSSRMLVLDKQAKTISDSHYKNLADFLNPGDVLVLNNTKVLKARLKLTNQRGKPIELIILEKHGNGDFTNSFQGIYKGKISEGDELAGIDFTCRVVEILGNGIAQFEATKNILEIVNDSGEVPIPSYLQREMEEQDIERYQTTFAEHLGSVAAPTASLNFTDELKLKLEQKGVILVYLTLHVGLGTFLPIRTDDVEEHEMHSEYFDISPETINIIRSQKNLNHQIIALGTTVARTLEYNAEKLLSDQSFPNGLQGDANIFMYPGYKFQLIDGLLTNFHAPKSTVLMLAGAFVGWEFLMKSYEYALINDYKFLSYGDSMLILKRLTNTN
jgi:S-adenosylmethionine:tRNA ribosyltransferase-isomerase